MNSQPKNATWDSSRFVHTHADMKSGKFNKLHWSLRDVDKEYWNITPVVICSSDNKLGFLNPAAKKLPHPPAAKITFEEYLKLQFQSQELNPTHPDHTILLKNSDVTTIIAQKQTVSVSLTPNQILDKIFGQEEQVEESFAHTSPPSRKENNDKLISNIKQTFLEAELQSGITVDQLLQSVSVKFNVQDLSILENVRPNLEKAFQAISEYQDTMESIFKEELFFEEDFELRKICKTNCEELTNQFKNNFGPFLSSVIQKLRDLETKYLKINQQMRETKLKSAENALLLAEKSYKKQMQSEELSCLADIEQLHANVAKSVRNAFSHAYGYENSRVSQNLLSNLDKKLFKIFQEIQSEFEMKMKEQEKVAETFVQNFVDEFKKELIKGIKTCADLDQFKNMQKSCFEKSLKSFDDSHKFVNVIRIKYLSKLKSEMEKLSTEFENQLGLNPQQSSKLSPSGLKSNKKQPECTSIGIHFGLDLLSVGTWNNGTYKNLYGPCPNNIVLGNEVLIGIPKEKRFSGKFIAFRWASNFKDFGITHNAIGKDFRIEEIVAFTLSKIHEIVKSALKVSNLFYVISFPTFFNHLMRGAMIDAVQISGLNAIVIRESCALMCKYAYQGTIQPKNNQRFLVAIEEENGKDCDIASYKFQNRNINISQIVSYPTISPHTLLNWFGVDNWNGPVPGIKAALEDIQRKRQRSSILLLCDPSNISRNIKFIQETMSRKTEIFQTGFSEIVEGTSMLAAYANNTSFKQNSTIDMNELLNSSQRDDIPKLIRSRIQHCGTRLTPTELVQRKIN